VIVGNPKPGSRTLDAALRVARGLSDGEPELVVDLAEIDTELLGWGTDRVKDLVARLGGCDLAVIASPTYKAAYTGLLKAWLDLLPQYALTDKTVLPLATGGSVAHALALDYGLRPVLSSMGARHIVQGFLVVDRYLETSPTGVLIIDAEVQPGLAAVVDGFLAALPAPVVARLSA
jgi:FMN reductase